MYNSTMALVYLVFTLLIVIGGVIFLPRFIGPINGVLAREGYHDLIGNHISSSTAKPIIAFIAWVLWGVFTIGVIYDLLKYLRKLLANVSVFQKNVIYTVAPGDNLLTIAARFYGTVEKWQNIILANLNTINPQTGRLVDVTNLIPGDVISVPGVSIFKRPKMPKIVIPSHAITDKQFVNTVQNAPSLIVDLDSYQSVMKPDEQILLTPLASKQPTPALGREVLALPPMSLTEQFKSDIEEIMQVAPEGPVKNVLSSAFSIFENDTSLFEWLYLVTKSLYESSISWEQAVVEPTTVTIKLADKSAPELRNFSHYAVDGKLVFPRISSTSRFLNSFQAHVIPPLPVFFDYSPTTGKMAFVPTVTDKKFILNSSNKWGVLLTVASILLSPWRTSSVVLSTVKEVWGNLHTSSLRSNEEFAFLLSNVVKLDPSVDTLVIVSQFNANVKLDRKLIYFQWTND
jgi:hypothetical protein